MSELIQKNDNRDTIRWKLLTGASAIALIASSHAIAQESADHPLLWIELGMDADSIAGINSPFTAHFLTQTPVPTPYLNGSPLSLQKPSRFTFGGEGSLTFQPEDSDWVFSAKIKYGRSNNKRDVHHQTELKTHFENPQYAIYKSFYPGTPTKFTKFPKSKYRTNEKFAETTVNQSERHEIVDFQAGKDVGLGMFGSGATSVVAAGVRVARFDTHSAVAIRARLGLEFYTATVFYGLAQTKATRFSTYHLVGQSQRSFNGIGPSLSWKGSAPVAGNTHDGELEIDWGVNGALLFGRQKAKVSHQTTRRDFEDRHTRYFLTSASGHYQRATHYFTHYQNRPPGQNRSRNVTVPNLGANVGISYRIEDAKLSIGYRADYFFGAMDSGIDAAKKSTLGFNGLYASISIGLGD